MFHRHKWSVVDKYVYPPPVTLLLKEATKIEGFNGYEWFSPSAVVHYKCNCGAEKVVSI